MLTYLRDRGVAIKAFSRDDAGRASSLVAEGLRAADRVSGEELDGLDPILLDQLVRQRSVFVPVGAADKERIVESLVRTGHYVAMLGDGVDDVGALQRAHVGVATQGGSSAARDVAEIVLLGGSFKGLQVAHHEGERIIGGISLALQAVSDPRRDLGRDHRRCRPCSGSASRTSRLICH